MPRSPSKKKKTSSPRRKKKEVIKLPGDCEKLAPSACTGKGTKDKDGIPLCKIKYSKLGFKNKCVENDEYELEKFIFSQGFEEFTRISEENTEEELRKRDEICKNLDTSACGTKLGRKLGCKVKKRLLAPDSCHLDPKLISFMKRRELLCERENCNELKKKGIICKKCTEELNETIQEYDGLFDILARKNNPPPEDVKRFFDLADDLKHDWYPYFVTGQRELLDTIERKRMRIEEIHGGARCQAYNITGCMGKGDNARQCKCKGIRSKEGLFCGTHRRCYKDRVEKFNQFRDKFDELCRKEELCSGLVRKMRELYEMIKYTTYGEASKKKVEVDDIIQYAEEYMKYM